MAGRKPKSAAGSARSVKKPYVNPCAKEARGKDERAYWMEAAVMAENCYHLARTAMAYHHGVEFEDVLPSPVGWALQSMATRFASVEQCALAVRKYRAEEKRRIQAKKAKS